MQIRLGRQFKERLQARYDRFQMEVGVLEDSGHKEPRERPAGAAGFRQNLSSFAGGPVRKKSRVDGPLTIAQVSAANRERLGVNFLSQPFKSRGSDIVKFSDGFFKMAAGKAGSMRRRCENLLQAIVRNPILRGEYGKQARSTTKSKGFYRPMIDTAQLFKAITARIVTRGRRV